MTAAYAIPPQTVELGVVLDVDLERDNGRERVFVEEWNGWLMLAGVNAMDCMPGRARLFLVRLPARVVVDDESGEASELRGADVYARWHKREPEATLTYDVPDTIGCYQGRALRIGYRSDKWHKRGHPIDYDHSFIEHGARAPKLYTDNDRLDRSRAAVLVGGDMGISERGIE